MPPIQSKQNSLVKRIREAIREHRQEIVLEGPKQVADAIAAGWKAIAILERERDLSAAVFDSLAETRQPQGTLGLFHRPPSSAAQILARRETVVIALDAVQDPGNAGTIIRLAAAFDAAGVLLLPGCADPFGPKAIRSSASAILSVPVAAITAKELLDSGLPLFATAMSGTPIDPPSRNAVLIFGNEGAGVSEEFLRHATRLGIPMSSSVDSLNVGSSAAILLARSYQLRTS